MPESEWVLIFADGTGQRGVREEETSEFGGLIIKSTNIFQMYAASDGEAHLHCFYDAGLGAPDHGKWDWTRTFRNLWSKATGWGITANIVDCYEAILVLWRPGMKIGLFGFSRGAYTVRCLGGVLGTCGIATNDGEGPISHEVDGAAAQRRRAVAEAAVAAYKIREKPLRIKAGKAFTDTYGAVPKTPDVIGVFDTVKALGLPGIANMVNPFQHEFHDNELSLRIPVGLQALSIDENRKSFAPVLWDPLDADARASGQTVEQVWFPGVHSDVGGGYDDDDALSRVTLAWMLGRLDQLADLHLPMTVNVDNALLGKAHDERTGMGVLWLAGERTVQGKTHDDNALCSDIEYRFNGLSPHYRPKPLRRHPRVQSFY